MITRELATGKKVPTKKNQRDWTRSWEAVSSLGGEKDRGRKWNKTEQKKTRERKQSLPI